MLLKGTGKNAGMWAHDQGEVKGLVRTRMNSIRKTTVLTEQEESQKF